MQKNDVINILFNLKPFIMSKSKLVLVTVGVCLSLLLVIPLYALLGEKSTKSYGGPVCGKEDSAVELYPNPYDCNEYYQCENGYPILQKCPEGLYFGDRKKTCTWPWDADEVFDCTE
jgi:hypothetical protein